MPYLYLTPLLVVFVYAITHGNALPLNKDIVTSLLAQGDAVQQGKHLLNLDNIVAARTPSSVVQDWSLVCQQLCGAALGGAVCAPYCKNLPFLPHEVQLENAKDILEAKQSHICPELCGLQLGDDVCTCKNYVTGNFKSLMKTTETTNICAVLCDYNSVTLTGCTPCNKVKNKIGEYMVLKRLAQDNTTPNYDQLCASLCKTGDGGSLCNCDWSPFFV